jgi:hypothetical protein
MQEQRHVDIQVRDYYGNDDKYVEGWSFTITGVFYATAPKTIGCTMTEEITKLIIETLTTHRAKWDTYTITVVDEDDCGMIQKWVDERFKNT